MTEKPDIIPVLEREGIELKQRGKNLWACCPFHSEKTPSFKVDTERQIFYCFGCHEHGDVIHFIEKLKGLSFKDALRYLGIAGHKPDARQIKKRSLIQGFRAWENQYHNDLCALYGTLQRAKMKIETERDLEDLAEFYHLESEWLYRLEILEGRSDKDKFNLYLEVRNNENGNGF